MKKRFLSFLLVLCMLLSMLPVYASASEVVEGGEGDNLAKDESTAAAGFYDLYVTDGLVAFFDAMNTANGTLAMSAEDLAANEGLGKWYAKVYDAESGKFVKSEDIFATIKGGLYSEDEETLNLTGWSVDAKGISYYTNKSIDNKISFPVELLAYEKYSVEFTGRVDLREIHDAEQETGTVDKVTAGGYTTYTHSGLTVLTYNSGSAYCTNRAYYTVVLKGEANAKFNMLVNDSPVTVTLDENGDYGTPVDDYTDMNVSTKVVKIIQSYTAIVDRVVWRK